MKKTIVALAALLMALLMAGCCSHEWQEAICENPKTCTECGKTEGEALGHDWQEATCETEKTCARCGETEGRALGHEAGEWEIEEEADFKVAGLRVQNCVRCGERLEEEEFYRPMYENGVFTFSANEFAHICESTWGDPEVGVDDDGAAYVLLTVDGEEGAKVYFLDKEDNTICSSDPEEAMDAVTLVVVPMSAEESVRARNIAIQVAICYSYKGDMVITSDGSSKLLEGINEACAMAGLYEADNASYFWGSYGEESALYIGLGDLTALYEERVIVPYFGMSFTEFKNTFNSTYASTNIRIETVNHGFTLYSGNTALGKVFNTDYTNPAVEAYSTSEKELFNNLVFRLDGSTGDSTEDMTIVLMVGGLMAAVVSPDCEVSDEGFLEDFMSSMEYETVQIKTNGLTMTGFVYEVDGYHYILTEDEFTIQALNR